MQINLTGHHLEITDALRDYVHQRLERIERHCEQVTRVQVILSVEKLRHKAEATLYLAGSDIFADAVDENMYAAIDILSDKLDRQIKKHKGKLTGRNRDDKVRHYP